MIQAYIFLRYGHVVRWYKEGNPMFYISSLAASIEFVTEVFGVVYLLGG